MLKTLMVGVLLLASAVSSAAAGRLNLSGKVVDTSGKPLADATIMVYHAGVRTGYSTFCPSCYADCGKRVVTDAEGSFEIAGLSPDLWFELLAARDGYIAEFVKKVDPAKNANVTIALAMKPTLTDFSGVVRGRVVDPDGSPIHDAVVQPFAVVTEKNENIFGAPPGLEPIAVTDAKGEFSISYAKPAPKMLLSIEARGMAPKFATMETGPERHTVTLYDGAAITGRLVANGKGVGNAEIGLIAKNRGYFDSDLTGFGHPYQEVRIGTNPDGSFTITNVPEPVEWYLYAKMDSIAQQGATIPVEVKTSHDKEYVHAPDLSVQPGFRLKGTVVLSDGKAIPSGMHIGIGSDRFYDTQTTILSTDGHFEFENLPAGDYHIFPSVKGYRVKGTEFGPFDVPVSLDRDINDMTVTVFPVNPAPATTK